MKKIYLFFLTSLLYSSLIAQQDCGTVHCKDDIYLTQNSGIYSLAYSIGVTELYPNGSSGYNLTGDGLSIVCYDGFWPDPDNGSSTYFDLDGNIHGRLTPYYVDFQCNTDSNLCEDCNNNNTICSLVDTTAILACPVDYIQIATAGHTTGTFRACGGLEYTNNNTLEVKGSAPLAQLHSIAVQNNIHSTQDINGSCFTNINEHKCLVESDENKFTTFYSSRTFGPCGLDDVISSNILKYDLIQYDLKKHTMFHSGINSYHLPDYGINSNCIPIGGWCGNACGIKINEQIFYHIPDNGNQCKNGIMVGASKFEKPIIDYFQGYSVYGYSPDEATCQEYYEPNDLYYPELCDGEVATKNYINSLDGPAIDGRIKPDLISKSPSTSYSTPRVAGGSTLLNEQWFNQSNSIEAPLASTIKALLIHTADNCEYIPPNSINVQNLGIDDFQPLFYNEIDCQSNNDCPDGPNFTCGYGTPNIENAADLIYENFNLNHENYNEMIYDDVRLNNNEVHEIEFMPRPNENVKITLVWNDPPADESTYLSNKVQFIEDNIDYDFTLGEDLDTTNLMQPTLVNNLNLKVVDDMNTPSQTFYPWVLNHKKPILPAKRGMDNLNNVEQVFIRNSELIAGQIYTLKIDHIGNLVVKDDDGIIIPNENYQDYSLIISGADVTPDGSISTIGNETIQFNDTIYSCLDNEQILLHLGPNYSNIELNAFSLVNPTNPESISIYDIDTYTYVINNFEESAEGNYTISGSINENTFEINFDVILVDIPEMPIIVENEICKNLEISNINQYENYAQFYWYSQSGDLLGEGISFEPTDNQSYFVTVVEVECEVSSEIYEYNAFDICSNCNEDLIIETDSIVIWKNNTDLDINGDNKILVSGTIEVYGRLIIEEGVTLNFTNNSQIIVHENAYLTIRDGVILTACDNLWKGIKVKGTNNQALYGIHDDYSLYPNAMVNGIPYGVNQLPSGGNTYIPTNLGFFDMYNGAIIEKAELAVDAANGINSVGAGIIVIGNSIESDTLANSTNPSEFKDNLIDIHIDYTNCCASGSTGWGYSSIKNANFFRGSEDYGIKLENAFAIDIDSISITNSPNLESTIKTNGIYAMETEIQLTNSNFENLVNGVFINRPYADDATASTLQLSKNANYIAENTIDNVEKGIYITGSYYGDIIEGNSFIEIPDLANPSPTQAVYLSNEVFDSTSTQIEPINFGLYMSKFDFGTIRENIFSGANENSTGNSYGLIADPRGGYNGTQNFFTNVDGSTTYDLISCNKFDRTDIGYQHQHGDSFIKVRQNIFAKDTESHDFSAWTVLKDTSANYVNYTYELLNVCDQFDDNESELFFNQWLDIGANTNSFKHIFANEGAFTKDIQIPPLPLGQDYGCNSNNINNYVNICQYIENEPENCIENTSQNLSSDDCTIKQTELSNISNQIKSLDALIQEHQCASFQNPCAETTINPVVPIRPIKGLQTTINEPISPLPCIESAQVKLWRKQLKALELQQLVLIQDITNNCETISEGDTEDNSYEEMYKARIKLLVKYGKTLNVQLQLVNLYLNIGSFKKCEKLMNQLMRGKYTDNQWEILCRKRTLNEIKIHRGTQKLSWKDIESEEIKSLESLASGSDAIANEAKSILASVESKPYFAPILKVYKPTKGNKSKEENKNEFDTFFEYYFYPNPASSKLNFNTNNENISELYLTDINGKILKKLTFTNSSSIDISDLSVGLYFAILKDAQGNTIHTHKIIKQ